MPDEMNGKYQLDFAAGILSIAQFLAATLSEHCE